MSTELPSPLQQEYPVLYQIDLGNKRSFAYGTDHRSDSPVVERTLRESLKLLNCHQKQEPKDNIALNILYRCVCLSL
jgi:hypothetical protein